MLGNGRFATSDILKVYETGDLQTWAVPCHRCSITAYLAERTRAPAARRTDGNSIYTGPGSSGGVCGEGHRRRHREFGGGSRKSGATEFLGHVVRSVPYGSSRSC